jgi:hypothetical protein
MGNTFLRELADHLAANTDFTLGTDLVIHVAPDAQDRLVSINEYPSEVRWSGMMAWSIQLLARAFDFWDARADSWTLMDLLSHKGMSLTSYIVHHIVPTFPPTMVGRDESGRALVSTRLLMFYSEV